MAMTPQMIQSLLSRTNKRLAHELKTIMAKEEIVKRTLNPLKTLWWKCMPGTTINVEWPTGWTEADHLGNQTFSADPNDHFRPWLEKNVGKQGWDWDWRLGPITGAQGRPGGPIVLAGDYLAIKFRKGKTKYATMFAMRWV